MLYLHIGSEKTGSSSIQWLLRNDAFAAATGIERLMTGSEWGQMTFVHSLRANSRRNAEVRSTLSGMAERVNADPAKTHVLTNEMLFRKGVAATLAESLATKVSVPVKVICYLRRPDAYMESLYKQRVKNGRIEAGAIDYLKAQVGDLLDFSGILGEYADQFGAENVVVRPYERERFPEGNVIMDFLSLIAVNQVPTEIETTLERNRSLSAICSELVGVIARTNRDLHQDMLNHVNSSDNKGLARSRDAYTLAERQAIMADCADNLEQVRKTFRPDLDAMFDMSDLAEGAPDPYPTAEERLQLTRVAAEEIIGKLCKLSAAAVRDATALDPEAAQAQRAERRQRRAARQAALATVDEPKPSQPAAGRKGTPPRVAAGQKAAADRAENAATAPRRARKGAVKG